tara:strand:- start:104 stop:1234 length:1131 start_codon:yes stop_codon:yes gene_type:complete
MTNQNITIPMIDLPRVHSAYQGELDNAVSEVLYSGSYIGGTILAKFEDRLSSFLNSKVFGVGNGTDALQIALMALGIKPGDEVIVPAFTYAASAEVIALLGAKAVWCDVCSTTFNLQARSVELALSSKTKAIIAVHLYGQLADVEALEKIADGIPIVEDAAQAFGAKFKTGKYQGKLAGTAGIFGTFSFFPTKPLGALGDGGGVACNDQKLHDRAFSISRHGQSEKYVHKIVGVNSRLDTIQAAILNVKLNHFEKELIRKVEIKQLYHVGLCDLKSVELPDESEFTSHVWHQYTIKVSENIRDKLQMYLGNKGVSSIVYYPHILADQLAYQDMIERTALSNSRALSAQVLSLPIDPSMSNSDVNFICKSIIEYFRT